MCFLSFMSQLVRENIYVVSKNQTLSDFLEEQCPFFSEGEYLEILFLDGNPISSLNQELNEGDKVILKTPQSFEPPVTTGYSVIYEDEFFFVVNKPANLPVHPAGKYYFNTLTCLLERDGFESSHPVNRLDKETSGLVLFAKNKELASALQSVLFDSAEKIYEGIVFGETEKIFEIDAPLEKMLVGDIRDHMVVDAQGQASKTSFFTIKQTDGFSYLQATLHTGRRHQIRAHLAYAGHPIVGDKRYGMYPDMFVRFVKDASSVSTQELYEFLGATRQLLHCKKLVFTHPVTGKKMVFEADLPKDFLDFLITKNLS